MNRFAWLLVVVVLVCAAWSIGWFAVANTARNAIGNMSETAGQFEPKFTCGSLNIGGFPFRFDIDCTKATLTSGDLTVTVAGLRASVLAYRPTHARLSAAAPMTLADAFTGARSRLDFAAAEASLRLTTDELLAGLGGAGWRLARASLAASDLVWTDTLTGERPIGSAGRLEAHLLDIPERHDAGAGTAALAAYAALSEVAVPGLAIASGEAALEAELTGLPDDLRRFDDPALLAAWQNAGGVLTLVDFEARAGEDFVAASGDLHLDDTGRPAGQLALSSRGLVERLGGLVPADWQALVLGTQAEDGSYSQHLTMRAGVIFSGLVPLGVLPPLI